MNLFREPRKRRLRRRSRGSRTRSFTAMRVSGMLSRDITEHTTMPLRLILPTAGQPNSFINMLDETSFPSGECPKSYGDGAMSRSNVMTDVKTEWASVEEHDNAMRNAIERRAYRLYELGFT